MCVCTYVCTYIFQPLAIYLHIMNKSYDFGLDQFRPHDPLRTLQLVNKRNSLICYQHGQPISRGTTEQASAAMLLSYDC